MLAIPGEDLSPEPVTQSPQRDSDLSLNLDSSLGFYPLQIIATSSVPDQKAYLNDSPDLPSLPRGGLLIITLGSMLRVRYASLGSLFP